MPTEPNSTMAAEAHLYGNVITLEVDNLLKGWPTYVIEFTPEKPGPIKLVLRLKDASERAYIQAIDSDDEKAMPVSKRERSIAAIGVKIEVDPIDYSRPKGLMCGCFSKPKAIPVLASGTLKIPQDLRHIGKYHRTLASDDDDDDDDNDDDDNHKPSLWPPPRTTDNLRPKWSLRALSYLRTVPVTIKPVEEA